MESIIGFLFGYTIGAGVRKGWVAMENWSPWARILGRFIYGQVVIALGLAWFLGTFIFRLLFSIVRGA